MTERIAFLLSKDPTITHGGDLTISRMLMDIARESHDVVCLCLSDDADLPPQPGLIRIQKPPVEGWRIGLRSLRSRRSLVHERYETPAFTRAIDHIDAEIFVADHSYMAEAYLRSNAGAHSRLLLNTVIFESFVWAQTRGLVGRLDGFRIRRDELRVARAAHAVASYDKAEADYLRQHGVERSTWLDITLPPQTAVDIAGTGRRLVFVGDRTWPPNADAYALLVRWWPEIADGIEGAELKLVGKPGGRVIPHLPDSVEDLGFVDDLEGLLATCRGLVAPVQTGGGVRVKILDAASRGMPVVGTSAGIGSLAEVFELAPHDTKHSFIARARALLLDVDLAVSEGQRLYDLNAARWERRVPQSGFERWLAT
jgi:glycosyltransferase involved in cell wall biosynthesis